MVLITIVTGAYKPINITGGPHIVDTLALNNLNMYFSVNVYSSSVENPLGTGKPWLFHIFLYVYPRVTLTLIALNSYNWLRMIYNLSCRSCNHCNLWEEQ